MSELETALLVVLIIIIIFLVWRWVRKSGDSCVKDSEEKFEFVKRGDVAKKSSSRVGKSLGVDGYGPGSDRHNSFMAAQFPERMMTVDQVDPGIDFSNHDDYMQQAALDPVVASSHKRFLKDTFKRTTTASMQSVPDHDSEPNRRLGLFKTDYHAVHADDPGARQTSSEHHTQFTPGSRPKWVQAGGS